MSAVCPPCARIAILVVSVLGCSRARDAVQRDGDAGPPPATRAPGPLAPVASSRVSSPVEPSGAPAPSALETLLKARTAAWNDAHVRRDAQALAPLYAPEVLLYTDTLPREQVLARKARAFAEAPGYTQSIAGLKVDLHDPARPVVSFDKEWTGGGKTAANPGRVRASLAFTRDPTPANGASAASAWRIVAESDVRSDAWRLQVAPGDDDCTSSVVAAVTSTEEGRALLKGPLDPAHGHEANGLRVDDGPPDTPTYTVQVFEDHPDHLVTLGWFEVDPFAGTVKSNDKVLTPDATTMLELRGACARAARDHGATPPRGPGAGSPLPAK